MRVLMAVGLVLGLGGSVWAEGDWSPENIVKVCNGGAECIRELSGMRAQSMQAETQREQSRQQAVGMALFGSGPALINGMNQGFQQMQVKPIPVMPLSPPVQYTPMPNTNPGWTR